MRCFKRRHLYDAWIQKIAKRQNTLHGISYGLFIKNPDIYLVEEQYS
jgi:hypothetical protein